MSFVRIASLLGLLGSVVGLVACADGIGGRPDARPDPDAASYADAGIVDAPLDAPVMEGDAPFDAPSIAEDDAASMLDAPITFDAFSGADALSAVDARAIDASAARDTATPVDVGPVWTIGFCRVQFPTAIMTTAGATTIVYARTYAAGLTERSGATDTDALLVAEVGHGPDASHPSMPSWTWSRGAANVGYGPGSAGYEPNNDEYQATLVAPASGTYDFAYRVSGDGGISWTYCDTLDPGSSDGYQLANAGALAVL